MQLARSIESRNEPGAYVRMGTSYQPTPTVNLRPVSSSPSNVPTDLRPVLSSPYNGPINLRPVFSGPSTGFRPSGPSPKESDEKTNCQEREKSYGQHFKLSTIVHKSPVNVYDATPNFAIVYRTGVRPLNSPAKDFSMLTPDVSDVAVFNLLDELKRALLKSVEATSGIATISSDAKTPTKSFYNNFRPTVPYATPYYGDAVPKGKNPPQQPSPRYFVNWH